MEAKWVLLLNAVLVLLSFAKSEVKGEKYEQCTFARYIHLGHAPWIQYIYTLCNIVSGFYMLLFTFILLYILYTCSTLQCLYEGCIYLL